MDVMKVIALHEVSRALGHVTDRLVQFRSEVDYHSAVPHPAIWTFKQKDDLQELTNAILTLAKIVGRLAEVGQ